MYLYFDRKGVLKEIINDEALRQGNYGVNSIKVFWEGTAEQDGAGTSYSSLEASYLREDGSTVGPILCDTFETGQIPFDRKRDLRWFKYYKDYRFCVIDLSETDEDDQSALDVAGTVHCSLIAHLALGDQFQLGQVNFEVVGDPRTVASQEYISLSDYKYLKKIVDGSRIEMGTVTASAESLPEGSEPTAEMDASTGYDAGTNTTVLGISLELGIPAGATGAQGPQGPKGDKGDAGTSVVIRESAAACTEVGNGYIDASGHLQVLTSLDPRTFVDAGQIQGPAGSVAIGTVTTGAPGSQASVTNSGTSSNAILNFTIPQGPAGANGTDGQDGQDGQDGEAATITIGTTTTGAAGSSAYVSNSGDQQHAVLNFTIPRGATGATGSTGPRGYPGSGLHKLGPYNSLTAAAQGIHNYFYQNENPVDWTSKVVSIVASKSDQVDDRTVVNEWSCEFHFYTDFDGALVLNGHALSVSVWYQGLTVLPQAYDPRTHGSLFVFVCTE